MNVINWPPHFLASNLVCFAIGVTLIKDLADEVDNMTPEVVTAALDVQKNPGSKEAREKLDALRQAWASKVQELTGAIDDVIDPEDFVTISGEVKRVNTSFFVVVFTTSWYRLCSNITEVSISLMQSVTTITRKMHES